MSRAVPAETLVKLAPPLRECDYKQINSLFQPYLFIGKGNEVWATCCGTHKVIGEHAPAAEFLLTVQDHCPEPKYSWYKCTNEYESSQRYECPWCGAKAKESAKKARADLKALKENPVIPDDTMAAIRKEAEEAAAKAAQEKVDKQVAEAEKRAEEAEKAAKEAAAALEQTKRQAAAADPDTAVFKTYFSTVQEDFNRLHGVYLKIQQSDPDKADKLKAAMAALLQKMGETWK